MIIARERFVQRNISHASTRSKYFRATRGDCEHGPEMEEEDSLNTASTFVKCAFDRSLFSVPSHPVPSRAGRLSRARNYSQFRVNESKTIRIAAQTRARFRIKARGTRRVTHEESIAKRERGKDKRKRERENEIKMDLYPPPPRADVLFPLCPPPSSPPGRSDPGGTPGLSPVPRTGRRRDF